MCMTDNFLCLRVFPVWKKDLRVRSEAVVFFFGFNLLNARRGVKPTQFDASARY